MNAVVWSMQWWSYVFCASIHLCEVICDAKFWSIRYEYAIIISFQTRGRKSKRALCTIFLEVTQLQMTWLFISTIISNTIFYNAFANAYLCRICGLLKKKVKALGMQSIQSSLSLPKLVTDDVTKNWCGINPVFVKCVGGWWFSSVNSYL